VSRLDDLALDDLLTQYFLDVGQLDFDVLADPPDLPPYDSKAGLTEKHRRDGKPA